MPMRFLLVAADEERLELARGQLRRVDPAAVIVEGRRPEDLARVGGAPYDLAVTDHTRRWPSAPDVVRAIKASWPATPVILFTATRDLAAVAEAMQAGLDTLAVASPDQPNDLEAAARRVLDHGDHADLGAMIASERRHRLLFQRNPEPMWVFDGTTTRILDLNEAAIRTYGYDRAEFLHLTLADLHPAEVRGRFAARPIARRWAGLYTGLHRHRRKDGSVIDVEITSDDIELDGRRAVVVLARNVTDRVRAEAALRESERRWSVLSRRLVQVQEVERRALARELHDEVGHLLTGLKLLVEGRAVRRRSEPRVTRSRKNGGQKATRAVKGAAKIDRSPERVLAIVDQLMDRVHAMSVNLRPPALDALGLVPALLAHLDQYTAQTGVRVEFHHGVSRRLPPDVEIAAFRLVQEGLTNVARHARVRRARVDLRADPRTLRIWIQDPGAGFDVKEAQARATAGLSGMAERARLLGGRLHVESTLDQGTSLHAVLPLRVRQKYASPRMEAVASDTDDAPEHRSTFSPRPRRARDSTPRDLDALKTKQVGSRNRNAGSGTRARRRIPSSP
jgi:PAS domain S-box-containing protein